MAIKPRKMPIWGKFLVLTIVVGTLYLMVGKSCAGHFKPTEQELIAHEEELAAKKELMKWEAISPATHLAEAKAALMGPAINRKTDVADKHLKAIPADSPEAKYIPEVAKEIRESLIEKRTIEQQFHRVRTAQDTEKAYLGRGIDARVRTSGDLDEVLEIKYVLAGRVMAYQMDQDKDMFTMLRHAGFKKLRLVGGQGFKHEWDLD